MKKHIIISALLLGLMGSVFAQDGEFGPAAGDFSGAVLFGSSGYQPSWSTGIPSAPYNNTNWTVSGSAPYLYSVEAGENTVTNIMGVEGRYFFTEKIAFKISGGAIVRSQPYRINIPGYTDYASPNSTWIPAYNAVVQKQTVDLSFNIGGDYFFPSSKFQRVFPYLGANIPFMYGRHSEFDPTITYNEYDEPIIADVGTRHAEVIAFGLQSVAGIDYYIAEGFYLGFEFKPISYIYAYNRKFPAPGLESLESDSHTWSFFNQIYLKLGFRF